jgi:hypothetical protein
MRYKSTLEMTDPVVTDFRKFSFRVGVTQLSIMDKAVANIEINTSLSKEDTLSMVEQLCKTIQEAARELPLEVLDQPRVHAVNP